MHHRTLLAAALGLALSPVSLVWGDTFVIPHVLEKSGSVTDTPFTFDTQFSAQYSGSSGATVDLYLYDRSTGQIMTGTNGDVCNPYTFDLDASNKSHSVVIDDLIVPADGFGGANDIRIGFGVMVVGGQDPDGVNLQGFVVNSHSSVFDLTRCPTFEPPPDSRAFVLPHVLEKAGKTVLAGNGSDPGGSTDTLLYPTYIGGLLGTAASQATVQLTLYNADGTRMLPGGMAFDYETTLSAANRSPLVSLEDVILDHGGFGGAIKEGYASVSVMGDAGNVAIQGIIVNSYTNAYDLRLSPVPEPSTLTLLGIGALGLLACTFRRQRLRAMLYVRQKTPAPSRRADMDLTPLNSFHFP
jgi:hypothetical protein